MKKKIALLLCGLMALSFNMPTFADETEEVIQEPVISGSAIAVPYSDGLFIAEDDTTFSYDATMVNGCHIENANGDVLSESYFNIVPLSSRHGLFLFSVPVGMRDSAQGVLKIEDGKAVILRDAIPAMFRTMDIGETAVFWELSGENNTYYDMNGEVIPDLGVYLKKYNVSLERSSWAEEAVKKAWDWGYMPEELGFNYKNNITRREYCHLAVNFLDNIYGDRKIKYMGTDSDKPFTDTDDPYVIAAAKIGIVSGMGDGTFMPDKNITRQEAAVLLWKMAEYMGIKAGEKPATFADEASMGDWAKQYIYNVCSAKDGNGNGIMVGTGNNKFSPTEFYTREQAIATVSRMLDVEYIQRNA